MVHSSRVRWQKGRLTRTRPFRASHYNASAALTGGGLKVKTGEVGAAHFGVAFLGELPEVGVALLAPTVQPLRRYTGGSTCRLVRLCLDACRPHP